MADAAEQSGDQPTAPSEREAGPGTLAAEPGHGGDEEQQQVQQAPERGFEQLAAATAPQLTVPPPPESPREYSSSASGATSVTQLRRCSSMEVSQSSPAELSGAKSWLRRAQHRADELRQLFGLPHDEAFLEDFMCALRKRMLLQGRMYVFSHHVCFSCNLFGYQKIKVIPLSEVAEVKKKKNLGFPNSIEITTRSGKREFFTSFLARAEAFKLVMAQWRECSDLAPPLTPAVLEPEPSSSVPAGGVCRGASVRQLFRSMGSKVKRENTPSSAVEERDSPSSATAAAGGAGGLPSVDEEAQLSTSGSELLPSPFTGLPRPNSSWEEGQAAGSATGSPRVAAGAEPSDSSLQLPEASAALSQMDSYVAMPHRGASPGGAYSSCSSPERASPDRESSPERLQVEFQQLTDAQCQRALEAEFGQSAGAEAPAAPPVDSAMQHVMEYDLPCTSSEFWCGFLANGSDFLHKFHARRGDSNIRVSKWQRHYKVGLVRDLQFITPVKARIGPPQAHCHQTQRVQVFAGKHLVLETSQVMSDIPYADHFTVETRWDVVPQGEGCHVTVNLAVPFSKKTMWKGFIEKGTFESSLESAHQFKDMAVEWVNAARAQGAARTGAMESEWGMLLSRGCGNHARKHSRTASLSASGVPVGRQLPMLARHRRSPSRVGSDGALHGGGGPAMARTPSLSRLGSQSLCSSPTARQAHQQHQHHAEFRNPSLQQQQQQPFQHASSQLPQEQHGAKPHARAGSAALSAAKAAASPLLALLSWLARLVASTARALRTHGGTAAVVCIGCVIMLLQAALLLQQRQQLAHWQVFAPVLGLGAPVLHEPTPLLTFRSGSNTAQQASSLTSLGRDLTALRQAIQQLQLHSEGWRAQLDAFVARLQEHAAAAAAAEGPR